ncbi:MAG TPA: hypothetical protein GX700_09750 [Paracoccus sp.]|nr:hypothetical protein [Paracoccus sp. (in: a-proteobacteria)]
MKRAISRPLVGVLALVLLAGVVIWDAARSGLPQPFEAPAPFALGSGAAPEGAHCTGG